MTSGGPVADYSGNRLPAEVRSASPPWLDGYDRRQLVLFTHVPKAGGTGLKQAMTHAYGRYFTDHHPSMNNVVEQVGAGTRNPDEVLALSSHLPFGFHRRIEQFDGRRVLPFTVVREPFGRMVSYYNFVTTFRPHRLHDITRDMDISTFFRHLIEEGVGEIANGQCRLVAGQSQRTAEAALETLEQQYFAYGPLDSHAELLDALSEALGWPPLPVETGQRNKSPQRATFDDLDPDVRDALVELNSEDLALYRALVARGVVLNDALQR